MTGSFVRRMSALVGGLVAAIVVAAFAPPAAAQTVPLGTQAIPLVGGPFANCPPGSGPQLVPGGGTINGVTVSGAAGRCTEASADAEGYYTVAGSFSNPLPFTAECHNAGGTIQGRSGAYVPAGTIVNGVAVAGPTVVEAQNAQVIFPGGRRATLNTVTRTADAVTFRAIVFEGGPTVGQVTCGVAAYPLALGAHSATGDAPAVAGLPGSAGEGSGARNTAFLAAGALALALLAQVVVARRIRRGEAGTTG
ncbi:MAG: hypothetical protein M3203_13455 [Actinomycetota bacterium]|nr:hypothetical protein [Actinomycetota bacterium]